MSFIQVGSLDIIVSDSGSSLHVAWRGEADERDPRRVIQPFLDDVAALAVDTGRQVVLDFADLQFMNSSCIGLTIQFLKTLQKANVKASVIYDTRHDWQTLSMKCTRTIFARYDNMSIVDRAGLLGR
jgi:hypothetical protein